jgi:type I restriction enzyme, S subunit
MKWEMVRLGDVVEVKNGRDHKKINEPNGIYPIVGSGGVMGYTNNFLCEAFATILGRKGSINKPFYIESRFWNVDTAFALYPIKIFPKFFYYFCTTYNFEIHNKSTTLPSLTKTDLLNIQIPLPPLPIQKRIAEILDTADTLRKKDELLLRKYDDLAQSLFIDMFGDPVKNEKGWDVKRLGDVCDIQGGYAFKSSDYIDSGIPLIRIGTINKGFFDINEIVYLPKFFKESYSQYLLKANDLLITMTGTAGKDDYGNVFLLDKQFDYYLLNQRIAKLELNEDKVSKIFIYFLLKQKNFKRELTGINRGIRQGNISNSDINSLRLPIPSMKLQKYFEGKYNKLFDIKSKLTHTNLQSQNLFQSLLQKAFRGELVS